MIARVVMMGAVLLTALLLQTVVLASVTIAGWRPDLVALTVVAFALADGADTGARYGFVAGLAADLLSSSSGLVGLTALVLLLVGDAVGHMRVYLTGMAWVGGAAIAGAATGLAFIGYGMLALLLDLQQFTFGLVVQGGIVEACWGFVLAIAVLRPVAARSRRFPGADLLPGAAAGTAAIK